MVDPRKLFSFIDLDFEVPLGLNLLAGLSGFTDAGNTLSQVSDHILENLDAKLIVQFDNDELLDYRARRPVMYFEKDHIESYQPAVLGIYLVEDETGQQFLWLNGYEPDMKWEAFTRSLVQIVDILGISSVTWVHSIPFPVPHTRAIGVTVSGNRKDLIDSYSEWKPQTQVPGNVLHLLEYRLSAEGVPVAGFVLLVPHYLADSEFPQAAVSALEHLASATGLVFPTDSLRDEGATFVARLEEQLTSNEELRRLIDTLEAGFDKTGPSSTPIRRPARKVPTADEIASELEDYLANREKNQGDKN